MQQLQQLLYVWIGFQYSHHTISNLYFKELPFLTYCMLINVDPLIPFQYTLNIQLAYRQWRPLLYGNNKYNIVLHFALCESGRPPTTIIVTVWTVSLLSCNYYCLKSRSPDGCPCTQMFVLCCPCKVGPPGRVMSSKGASPVEHVHAVSVARSSQNLKNPH